MKLFTAGLVLIFAVLCSHAYSAEIKDSTPGSGKPLRSDRATIYSGRGKVHAVNLRAGTIHITYDAIGQPHLPRMGWPGLNPKYRVQDPAMLEGIKPGMTVDFKLDTSDDHNYRIVSITPASE